MSSKNLVKRLLGEKLWRKIKIAKYYSDNPEYRELTKENARFRNIHTGERCFIVGNGPSLKRVDLSLLKDEITFTVNQLPRNAEFPDIQTNYHIWSDTRFFEIDIDKPEEKELMQTMLNVNLAGNPLPQVFYKIDAKAMINKYSLDEKLNIAYFTEVYSDDVFKTLCGGIDLCEPLPTFPTVIQYAICIAIYMGFSEIYLLGCDCSGFISTAEQKLKSAECSLYAYSISEMEKKRLEKVANATRIEDELQWYVEMFKIYNSINKYCKQKHILLCNCTDTTLLDGIEKVDLQNVLKKKKGGAKNENGVFHSN